MQISCALGASAIVLALVSQANAAAVKLFNGAPLQKEIIYLEGRIVAGDLQRVKEAVRQVSSRLGPNHVYLALNSPGGQLKEGLAIARYLRSEGVGTILLPSARCFSACSFIFFGGYDRNAKEFRRLMFPAAQLGVHSASLNLDEETRQKVKILDPAAVFQSLQRILAELLPFFEEMQITTRVQQKIFSTDHKEIYIIKNEDLLENRVSLLHIKDGKLQSHSNISANLQLPIGAERKPSVGSVASKPDTIVVLAPPREPSIDWDSRAEFVLGGGESDLGLLRRFDGSARLISLAWTKSFDCLEGSSRGSELRINLCLGDRNPLLSINYSGELLEGNGHWTEFESGSFVDLHSPASKERISLNPVRQSRGSSVFRFTTPPARALEKLTELRGMTLDFGTVRLVARFPEQAAANVVKEVAGRGK